MEAQPKTQSIAGEYFLRGVMETASGLKLNPDSTFEFYFSYGALDRSGSGTWEKKGNKVIFNSYKPSGKNISLIRSNFKEGDKLTIKIQDANPSLRSHVYIMIKSEEKQSGSMTDKNGIVNFPIQIIDTILASIEFCPEKVFTFHNEEKTHNYFEFMFEKDIMEVFFNQHEFILKGDELHGKIPLLKEGEYEFIRQDH